MDRESRGLWEEEEEEEEALFAVKEKTDKQVHK